MKTLFSILTASAAGFMAIGAASAADLPSKKAAPAQYVKICDAFGAGFFYIPGTDTCLKVGGKVRAEYRLRTHPLIVDTETTFRIRGYINLDARTKTSYGDLRTFIELRATEDTPPNTGAVNSGVTLTNAYIQWAGITAGRRQNSFFDFYTQEYEFLAASAVSSQFADVLAYTATFGGGFSATLSLENPTFREQGNNGTATLGTIATGAAVGKIGYNANGERAPDVIAALRAEGTWGSAQLSAAYHQVNALVGTTNITKAGYGVQAGVKINLPMLAAGDSFVLQGAYGRGATEYVNSDNFVSVWGKAGHVTVGDQTAIATSGSTLGLVSSYVVFAGLQHYWTSTVYQSVYADYYSVKNPSRLALGASPFLDQKAFQVGTRLAWTPVKGLTIGPEVLYENVKSKTAGNSTTAPAAGRASANDLRFNLRLERSF